MNYQLSRSELALPIVGQGQNGTGQVFKVSRVFDSYGSTTWVKSPRGFISHFVYDVSTGALKQRIEDVKTDGGTVNPVDVPDGWVTPVGGGLDLVTDYDVDNFGRVVRELGPVHEVQLNGAGTTSAVRQVSFTVYDDAAREVRRASGYGIVNPGSPVTYTFVTVGSATITRTKVGDVGLIEETIEAIRANNDIPLTSTEDFSNRSKWRKWSFTESDQWGKAIQGRVYHLIPGSNFGSLGENFEMVEYGYDAMNRLVRLEDETRTITRTVYDVRGLVLQTWVGTDDFGATDQAPGNSGAGGNNMVMVSKNDYDDGNAGGNGYLTEIVRKVDGIGTGNDRVEKRKYDYRGQLEEVRSSDGLREIRAAYTYDNLGRVTEVHRYRGIRSLGFYLGKSVSHYDDDGRVYRTEAFGADEATGDLTRMPRD